MSTSSSTLSLIALSENDKLCGYENYTAWKTLMEAYGRPKGLHKYWENLVKIPTPIITITSTDAAATVVASPSPGPTPVHSTTPSELEYELRENVALSSILINIVDIAGSGINPLGTSNEAWKLLLDQYGKTSDRARKMREEALANCKMTEGGKVAGEGGHIEKMRTLRKSANDAGADIKDPRFITKLLDSFPESWDAVITPMYSETSLSTVIMNLTTHAERLAIRDARTNLKPDKSIDTVRALEATVMALQAEMKTFKLNRGTGTSNPNKAHLKCTNTQCGKTGHLIDECFQPGGGKAGQYPPWWKGKRTPNSSVPSANLATSFVTTGDIANGSHYALSASFDIKNIEEIIAQNGPVNRKIALAAAENPGTLSTGTACVADSGCTTYFFKSREAFSSYKPSEKAAGQSSKEGASFTVLGVGTVQVKVVHNGLEQTLSFSNALHAPDVTANLISVSRMDLEGWDVVFGGKRARFFKDKKEIFGGILKNGLYLIGGSFLSSIPTSLTARSLRSPGDIALWHRRFAHFGVSRIAEASKLVNGLEITSKDVIGKCEDCIIGNQKRRPYDENITPETEVL